MDPTVRSGLRDAAERLGIPAIEMPSGAGHDAAAFGAAGVSTGMIFIRNPNGSHNPDEAMSLSDFKKAADVLSNFLLERARSDERREGKGCISTVRFRWSPIH